MKLEFTEKEFSALKDVLLPVNQWLYPSASTALLVARKVEETQNRLDEQKPVTVTLTRKDARKASVGIRSVYGTDDPLVDVFLNAADGR